jgi:phosphoribosylamine--glycine ligase
VLKDMLASGRFGTAGERVVLEQFLQGIEVSAFLITDGTSFKMLPPAKDYKRIGDGDTGPNTGGMGAVSPVTFADKEFMQKVHDRVAAPTVRGLREDGIPYQGFIFMGLMNVGGDPYVIEYNVRLGDPETQAILPRLRSDLLDLFVVLASEGYPENFRKGLPIGGLELVKEAHAFHAGTTMKGEDLVTDGGRVMALTAFGKDTEQAIANVYRSVPLIEYEGKYFRRDIGRDLVRTPQKA